MSLNSISCAVVILSINVPLKTDKTTVSYRVFTKKVPSLKSAFELASPIKVAFCQSIIIYPVLNSPILTAVGLALKTIKYPNFESQPIGFAGKVKLPV